MGKGERRAIKRRKDKTPSGAQTRTSSRAVKKRDFFDATPQNLFSHGSSALRDITNSDSSFADKSPPFHVNDQTKGAIIYHYKMLRDKAGSAAADDAAASLVSLRSGTEALPDPALISKVMEAMGLLPPIKMFNGRPLSHGKRVKDKIRNRRRAVRRILIAFLADEAAERNGKIPARKHGGGPKPIFNEETKLNLVAALNMAGMNYRQKQRKKDEWGGQNPSIRLLQSDSAEGRALREKYGVPEASVRTCLRVLSERKSVYERRGFSSGRFPGHIKRRYAFAKEMDPALWDHVVASDECLIRAMRLYTGGEWRASAADLAKMNEGGLSEPRMDFGSGDDNELQCEINAENEDGDVGDGTEANQTSIGVWGWCTRWRKAEKLFVWIPNSKKMDMDMYLEHCLPQIRAAVIASRENPLPGEKDIRFSAEDGAPWHGRGGQRDLCKIYRMGLDPHGDGDDEASNGWFERLTGPDKWNNNGSERTTPRCTWPALSPDINMVIEHLWYRIQRQLRLYYDSVDAMIEHVQELWSEIPQSYIANLFDTMPRVMEAIIAAEGGDTKY